MAMIRVETPTKRDWKYLRWCMAGASIFSTCAKRQYMALVVSASGRTVGTGYNGSPPGLPHCTDGFCPRLEVSSASGLAYDNCVSNHAEENALMFSDWSARQGGTLYVNGTPCWGCAKKIAGSGLDRLVFIEDAAYVDWPRCAALLGQAGVTLVPVNRADGLEAGTLTAGEL
jgi:dCMP deaminase